MTMLSFLELAVKKGASDVHLAVGHRPTLRIDGELWPQEMDRVLTEADIKKLALSFISDADRKKFLAENDLDTAVDLKGQRFRINIHLERGRMAFTARVIPKKIPTMDAIGLMPLAQELINLRNGLVLVTGPAGTGKSTTLAAMINAINLSRRAHVITLEDPIEFIFPQGDSLIKQREVGVDVSSFRDGLKHVLRQDPDVIMIGEMRDLDSIAAAITLAETGHLVFSTIHTRSAAETVQRIIDSFPGEQQHQARSQISQSLRAVISQTLLPSGKKGRVAAREVLINNAAIGNLIRQDKIEQIPNVIQTSARLGMTTMKQDMDRLLREKLITKETAKVYFN